MKKLTLIPAAFFSILLLFAGCSNADKPDSNINNKSKPFSIDLAQTEIDEANRQFVDLFNKGDSVGLANMFTVDGKSMEPNEPSFVGRENIQTHYSLVMKAGANRLGLKTTGLWGDEKMLAEEGEFSFSDSNGNLLDIGKYIVLWRKEDGAWKLFRDCYNSDLPCIVK